MTCACCHSTELVEIRMRLRARAVTMRSCLVCEHRWWERDGEQVGVGSILDLVAAG